jgi:hypothetical protein
MKPHTLLFRSATLALLLLGNAAHAQDGPETDTESVEYQLILPDEKTPESIKPTENNPFIKTSGLEEDESSSEENAVRAALMTLTISGVSNDAAGNRRLMLGPMKLERGMVVPPVLADQAVHLRVNAITQEALELVWIEKKNTGMPPRALIIPFNVKPTIRTRLAGFANQQAAVEQRVGVLSPHSTTSPTAGPSTASAPPQGTDSPSSTTPSGTTDEAHPANMLMNLLLKKSQPTQQTAPEK